ncbi:hypothetical protein [Thalassobacillus sp. C254]|nr:hypothetical protein [Thalassobacillus sp. C254]
MTKISKWQSDYVSFTHMVFIGKKTIEWEERADNVKEEYKR